MKNRLRKLLDRLFSRYVSTGLVFALDVSISFISALLVIFAVHYLVSVAGDSSSISFWNHFVWPWLIVSTVSAALMFWGFKSYRIIIRHSSLADIFRFCLAVFCASLIDGAVFGLTGSWPSDSRANWLILAAYCILCIFLLVLFRVLMIRTYEELQRRFRIRKAERMRVLIFGTDEKSLALRARLQSSRHYEVAGYLTDIQTEEHLTSHSLPVFNFGNETDVARIAKKQELGGIIFAREEDLRREAHRLIPYATACRLRLLVEPSIGDYRNVSIHGLRSVKVEDLLGRDEISISMDRIKERFSGKVVLVTGASGSIGSELCRQLARIGVNKLILYDNAETPMHNLRLELEDRFAGLDFVPVIGDVRQKERLDHVFRSWHPQVVFHAAAYKHVPLMEDNPCEAVQVNLIGSRHVADKCVEYGAEMMVMISTDKAVNPTNIMGCTKRLAEIYVQSIDDEKTKFVTTRFGNVLGSSGSVIPRFQEQIESGGPVTVTHPEITRYFMTIPEACLLVMEAATMSDGKDIYVFDMGSPVKIDHLARRMIELAGLEPDKDIRIVYSGLRPGEKLYEEVLSDKENTEPTSHDLIRIAHVRQYAYAEACRFAEELADLSRKVHIPEMVKRMKEIVPEFRSQNSKFQVYDK